MSKLTAQPRRWRSSEGQELGPGQEVPPPFSSLQNFVCPSRKTFLWKSYGDSELGVFKVTLDQVKLPSWQPCIPSLCESTTGWQLS